MTLFVFRKMKSLCCWIGLIAILFLPEHIYCQEIQLNELRRTDCTQMETVGLVDTFFSYFFNATVKLSKQLEDYTIVQFEILRRNSKDYSFLFDVPIAYECLGLKLEISHQCKKIGDGIFNIDVFLRNESGDKIRGQVIHYNKSVLATDVKELSGDNETAESTGVLKINGEEMSSDMNCTKIIDVKDLIVEFECSNPDAPCVIEVKVDDAIVIDQNTDYAVYEDQVQSERDMLVSINYGACNLNGKVNQLRCFIKIVIDESGTDGCMGINYFLIISLAVVASVLILIVLLVIFLVKRHKRQKITTNKNSIGKDERNNEENRDITLVLNGSDKNVRFCKDIKYFEAKRLLLEENGDEPGPNETTEEHMCMSY
ncbi:unnamed protein product [Lymnaea stagnalis]|uniref:Uncharacterized protein n=1 Tax=Lymnaea stagnalis TaxID=6523 RepID=A0AAV2H417_LYMST